MRTAASILLVLAIGCAGARPAPEELPPAPPPAPTALDATVSGSVSPGGKSTFNPKVWVGWQDAAAECEASARAMRETFPEDAWQALKACVELGHFNRGPFTQIDLLTAHWAHELKTRADAVRLLAHVIANRGGDVDGDVSRVQASRVPVFTLRAALAQPDVYKGRYVILRGKLTDVKMESRSATAMLDETAMKPVDLVRLGQDARYIATETDVVKVYDEHRFSDNVSDPTGRKVLGRLPEADPFLEPDREFVFVGRFDGARTSNVNDEKIGLVDILGYYRPAALVVQ